MTNDLPSRSASRLAGDDYQHLLTWIYALKLLLTDSGITKIEFEANNAGNVDDLVVHCVDAPALYHQIKFAVTPQNEPLTHQWFTAVPSRARRSPLQRFHESYEKLRSATGWPPEMAFHTNRLPASDDPLLKLVSGRDCKLVPRLNSEHPGSDANMAKLLWEEHLGVEPDKVTELLGHLSIRCGRSAFDELEDHCSCAMTAAGLRGDRSAILAALGALRQLIETGIRELDADGVREMSEELGLIADQARGTLLVQALQPDPWPEAATAAVDWVDLFDGRDAASRRQLKNPSDWNERLRPELVAAVEQLRRARLASIEVQGTMRLGVGLFVGQLLSDVAGFTIARRGRDGEWASDGEHEDTALVRDCLEFQQGRGLAVALAISQPIRDDVARYIEEQKLPVERLVVYSPASGPDRFAVSSPAVGLGFALAISTALRQETSGGGKLHLFQASPLPLSIMVGHFWNRMPPTQIYDDLGPGAGYTPTFSI
jgi:hypothetical protein